MAHEALVEPLDFAETGRGLGCVRDVAEGEELLVVPLSDCWWAPDSRAAAEIAPLLSEGIELSNMDVCALHLLVERRKGAASTRWAHLCDLPRGYDSPLFWSDEEMAALEGSEWRALAVRFLQEVKEEWEALQAKLRDAGEEGGGASFLAAHSIDWDGYLWAYATLKSRQVEACVRGEPARLLAPRFDLFNHSDALVPGSSHFFDDARAALVCRATHPHAKGEQAFISYGTASNGSLLLGGGFVLRSNRFDFVEVLLTSECDAPRLPLYMMAAPDVPPMHELAQFEFVTLPTDEEVAEGKTAPFVTRHRLTLERPVPSSLVARVRLDRMSDEELQLQQRRAAKAGVPLWEAARGEAPLDPLHEVITLGALRSVVEAKLRGYPTTVSADEEMLERLEHEERPPTQGSLTDAQSTEPSVTSSRRKLLALLLCLSEKRILLAAMAELDARLHPLVRELLASAMAQDRACRSAKKQWAALLSQRESVLKQQMSRVLWFFERVHACSLGSEEVTLALHAQACTTFLMLLSGLGTHPRACLTAYVPAASPFPDSPQEEGETLSRLPPLSPSLLSADATAELPYLSLYTSKMAYWGAYLLSQWGAAKALNVEECSTMQQEAVSIRRQNAWSVPTAAALDEMCRHSPLLEMGAGTGLWASLLAARGADIEAFDTLHWQEEFADGSVEAHAGRTLVLMWPDYAGRGSYGVRCLQKYRGDRLILVGEWRDATLGAFSAGMAETGQSFSAELQQLVESEFELESRQRLPNWPLFMDVFMVWRRKL
ncbi:hypothetical protein AB1Y20_002570 [Prymnesium parvum]|uniref:SET domain-containing protein n=1 Tax=Prymnesium parvum TaxID=97485 RepID=A0AB34JC66_PRYPA